MGTGPRNFSAMEARKNITPLVVSPGHPLAIEAAENQKSEDKTATGES